MDALRLADRNAGVDAACLGLTPLTNDVSKEFPYRVGP